MCLLGFVVRIVSLRNMQLLAWMRFRLTKIGVILLQFKLGFGVKIH